MRRLPLLAALAALGFAVLAALVATGALTSLDQWAVEHVMPGLDPSEESLPLVYGLMPLAGVLDQTVIQVAMNAFTLPGSATVSALVLAAGGWTLVRRGETRAALPWAGAWLAANGVEVLAKTVLERPALADSGIHLADFDQSYPSGHAARGLLVAVFCAYVWPRTRVLALAWAALALPALVVAGFHTPSDVTGGVLLAACLAAAAASPCRSASRRSESVRGGRLRGRPPRSARPF